MIVPVFISGKISVPNMQTTGKTHDMLLSAIYEKTMNCIRKTNIFGYTNDAGNDALTSIQFCGWLTTLSRPATIRNARFGAGFFHQPFLQSRRKTRNKRHLQKEERRAPQRYTAALYRSAFCRFAGSYRRVL